MKVVLLSILFCVDGGVVADTSPRFKSSFLEQAVAEDVVTDLAGRHRVIIRDTETDKLQVFWVLQDRETLLPFVKDPVTKLPYLLQYKQQEDYPLLFRMIRGKDHRFIVTDTSVETLYRPELNSLGEVDLSPLTEKEAGFTRKEVKQL